LIFIVYHFDQDIDIFLMINFSVILILKFDLSSFDL